MHVVIYFGGTNEDDGASFTAKGRYRYLEHSKTGAGAILVKGCAEPEVCGSIIFPNLKKFAERFVNQLFVISPTIEKEERVTSLKLNDFKIFASIGVIDEYTTYLKFLKNPSITSITLAGYSRGGVTCFEVARVLNEKVPHIPVDIVADQPVPGNISNLPGTNTASISDCSHLKNLTNVTIILAANTGMTYTKPCRDGMLVKYEAEKNIFHRAYFSQIVPKLPLKPNLIVIPRENHQDTLTNEPDGCDHMHMQIAQYLYQRNLIEYKVLQKKIRKAAETYTKKSGYLPALFPPSDKLQPIFGLDAKEVYRHLDKLHPMPKITAEFGLNPTENLLSWWNRQEKLSFPKTSKNDDDLIDTIKKTKLSDENLLEELLNETDKWLTTKENRTSLRYTQVKALRDNIYYVLVNKFNKKSSKFYLINRQSLAKENYFFNHWKQSASSGFSFSSLFQSEKIDTIEKAFLEHKKVETADLLDYRDIDLSLLKVLDDWLASVDSAKSKYTPVIIEIRDLLEYWAMAWQSLMPDEEKEKAPQKESPTTSQTL